ncbi:hypothetical protein P1A145kb_p041 [Pectobacterium phage DU_PP_I]|nr:hypothetical protein P1A145kb_p041 [Pectobacterium phage DU_PP_I]ATS93757.1 hypothetical protein P12B145kb_p041 [Pectobacterium phage DU_PP_IV]
MKKLILLAALALAGCDKPGRYDTLPVLLPEQVVELHRACQTQPDFKSSRVIVRDSSARAVICRYQDKQPGSGGSLTTYEVDAKILQLKIQEGLK